MAETLVVIGSGVMGCGIAYAGALGGFKVRLVDVRPDILHQAENRIESVMEKGLSRGKINGADAERIKANIEYTVDLPAAAGCADVIIEAVPEKTEIKKEVFEKMDRFAPAGCILATNTSTMSPTEIGSFTTRPASVIAMHFFSIRCIKCRLSRSSGGLKQAMKRFNGLKKQLKKWGKKR